MIENISRVTAVKKKMIHSDQLEFFLPIFPLLRILNLDAFSTERGRSFLL